MASSTIATSGNPSSNLFIVCPSFKHHETVGLVYSTDSAFRIRHDSIRTTDTAYISRISYSKRSEHRPSST